MGAIPSWYSPVAASEYAQASIEDYGRQNDAGPYQVVNPAYPAPEFLKRFAALEPALRECATLCTLKGTPFRVVRWGREGSGARGGISCAPCRAFKRIPRFPERVPLGSGCLQGYPDATPVAEFDPSGQVMVFDACGNAKLVGHPNYIVSHTPFPRLYKPEVYPQRYLEAVKTGQLFAAKTGRRVFICSSFGEKCEEGPIWVPVVYVDPGGLRRRYDDRATGTVEVTPVSPEYFRELVMESRGGTYLGQGA